jgi:hypothetical protein
VTNRRLPVALTPSQKAIGVPPWINHALADFSQNSLAWCFAIAIAVHRYGSKACKAGNKEAMHVMVAPPFDAFCGTPLASFCATDVQLYKPESYWLSP